MRSDIVASVVFPDYWADRSHGQTSEAFGPTGARSHGPGA